MKPWNTFVVVLCFARCCALGDERFSSRGHQMQRDRSQRTEDGLKLAADKTNVEDVLFWGRIEDFSITSVSPTSPSPTKVDISNHPTGKPKSTSEPSPDPSVNPSAVLFSEFPSEDPSLDPSPLTTYFPTLSPSKYCDDIVTDRPTVEQPTGQNPSLEPTNENCNVTATIHCRTDGELPCSSLEVPRMDFCDGNDLIQNLTFRVTHSGCQGSHSSQSKGQKRKRCADFGTFRNEIDVHVSCKDQRGLPLLTDPGRVSINQTVQVLSPIDGHLPAVMTCTIFDSDDKKIQVNKITLKGKENIRLYNQFGALSLESCGRLDCRENLVYTYRFENIGSSEMAVVAVDRHEHYHNETKNLLQGHKLVIPGKSISVEEKTFINACDRSAKKVDIRVTAISRSGKNCSAVSSYTIDITPSDPPSLPPIPKTRMPSLIPSDIPTQVPTRETQEPSMIPSQTPSRDPTPVGTKDPTDTPSTIPSILPTFTPSNPPSLKPTPGPSNAPTKSPTGVPTGPPSGHPTKWPSHQPSSWPSPKPSQNPTRKLSQIPTERPSLNPTVEHISTESPTKTSSLSPRAQPTGEPSLTHATTLSPAQQLPSICEIQTFADCITTFGQKCDDATCSPSATDDPPPLICGAQTCLQHMHFAYNVTNVGTTPATISLVRRQHDQTIPISLVEPLLDREIGPGESLLIKDTIIHDFCQEQEFNLRVDVTAFSSDGKACNSEYRHGFLLLSPPLTGLPTSSPTDEPTQEPSQLTVQPTTMPSGACNIEFKSKCSIPSNGHDCAAIPPTVTQCSGRPLKMWMLYTGGNCDMSFNVQEPKLFECFDIDKGPPVEEGTRSFIVVTSLDGDIVYHRGWVKVGDQYELFDGGEKFEANQNITIYGSRRLGYSTMLQTLRYHSSCSQNLFLKDRFGASQLVVWQNEDQGVVTCFANASFTFRLTIPFEVSTEDRVSLTSLVSITSFGTFDLTDQVLHKRIRPGKVITARVEVPIDLTVRRNYQLLTTVSGISDSGTYCRGVDYYAFTAGNPLPPSFPSLAPTAPPTTTTSPTPDPLLTACDISAHIECELVDKGGSETDRDCRRLKPPKTSVCLGDQPTELRLLYTGNDCTGANATSRDFKCRDFNGGPSAGSSFVTIEDDRKGGETYFRGIVQVGEIISVRSTNSEIGKKLAVHVYAKVKGQEGSLKQKVELPSKCDERSDVRLLTHYGAMQITAFRNRQRGFQRAIERLQHTFVIQNLGKLKSVVVWANVSSDLYGDMSLIEGGDGLQFPPGLKIPFEFGQTFVNLYSARGKLFRTDLSVSGYGLASGLACNNTDVHNLRIGP